MHNKLTNDKSMTRLVQFKRGSLVIPLHVGCEGYPMMMKKTLITILFASMAQLGQAAYIANRDFLSVGQGARANAMGEAFVAVADDASAVYWNPAGMTQMTSDEVSTGFSNRYDGLAKEAQLNYARRGVKGMWGFSYMGNYVTDIPITQSLTQADLDAITTGAFAATDHPTKSVMDHALLIGHSRPLMPDSRHAVGATAKLIYKDLLGMVQGYGAAVDIGYLYTSQTGAMRYGLNVQNVASITSYVGTIDNLGQRATATESYIPNIKTGFAYTPGWRLLNGKLLTAFDVNMLSDMTLEDYRLGLEYSFGEIIALRGGKVFNRQEDASLDWTLGMGLRLKSFLLDFSFLTSDLGDTTRGTLSYRLGGDYYTPAKY